MRFFAEPFSLFKPIAVRENFIVSAVLVATFIIDTGYDRVSVPASFCQCIHRTAVNLSQKGKSGIRESQLIFHSIIAQLIPFHWKSTCLYQIRNSSAHLCIYIYTYVSYKRLVLTWLLEFCVEAMHADGAEHRIQSGATNGSASALM